MSRVIFPNKGFYEHTSTSSTVGIREDHKISLPDRIVLFQNYPNPFNPNTTIQFILQYANSVKLTVYDNLGNEVKILVNDYKQSGTYEVQFDASTLVSGIYYYKIQAGNYVLTKKMVLLK